MIASEAALMSSTPSGSSRMRLDDFDSGMNPSAPSRPITPSGTSCTLVFDAAIGTIELDPVDPARWREQLKELARRMVKMMAEDFPGIALLAMTHIPTGENAMRGVESMLSLLKAGGASDEAAGYAADLLSLYVTAIAYEQSLYRRLYRDPDHEQREVEALAQRFASLDPERFPTMAAIGPAMTRGDGDERFELGLDVLINGLLATPTEGRLTASPGAPGSR